MSDSEDPLDAIDEGGDDLFGDEGDEGDASPQGRILDDDELASDPEAYGDAEPREYDGSQSRHETKERVVMAVQAYRHRVPKPSDDAVSVLDRRACLWVIKRLTVIPASDTARPKVRQIPPRAIRRGIIPAV